MNNIFGIFQLIGGIIMSIGYIPQIVQHTQIFACVSVKQYIFQFIFCKPLDHQYSFPLQIPASIQVTCEFLRSYMRKPVRNASSFST